jgi:hypothetical protein
MLGDAEIHVTLPGGEQSVLQLEQGRKILAKR